MLATHFAGVLGVPTKHPMIYNGHRSLIVTTRQEIIPLYLSGGKAEYRRNVEYGIQLLESNLKRIKRALERLQENYGMGVPPVVKGGTASQMEAFPNNIVKLLYEICEFQV